MPTIRRLGFFDIQARTAKLTEMGDPLGGLNKRGQSYAVSDAAVHDSQVFEALLDEREDAEGKKRAVYADSAYRCNEREQTLGANGFDSQIHETWHAGSSAARRAKGRKQGQIADAGAGKACVRCSARDGRTRRAHDWPGACEGENWGAESGLQHEAPGAAGQTRCVGCDGASQPSRQSCMRSGLNSRKSPYPGTSYRDN